MNGLAWVIAPEQVMQVMLILGRVAGIFAAAPIFSHQGAPMRVRAGLALGIALAFAGHVPADAAANITTVWGLVGATLLEMATGVMLGLAPQLIVSGLLLGGQVAGIHMGLGVAELVDPATRVSATPVALWLQFLGLLIFLALDVHHLVIRALARSLTVAPPGALRLGTAELGAVLGLVGGVFEVGLRVAAPVLAGLLITDTGLGLLARAIPELNVFFLGFAVKIGVGFLLLGASLPFAAQFLELEFRGLESVLAGLVRLLG
jgi:flagellar biosynthetic protein FliR